MVLAFGEFEGAEVRALCACASPGSAAIDVGANVGMVTIPLALAVGNQGKVIAFEPVAASAARLRENLRLNGLTHVVVHEVALGEQDGEITLQLGSDPVFHSSTEVLGPWRTDESVRVPCRTLDAVWEAEGRPSVSVVKIDVEGAELSVLKGGRGLLAQERPALLLELLDANYDEVVGWLRDLGYRPSRPRGFAPWNHLFLPVT
jgi:FkbM family methyltransferase